ncbi:MAG: hypothetical protein ABIP75_00930 [Pyrinomonadaceae bacterium]
MVQNENRLRLTCGAGTLAAALAMCWLFEVILDIRGNHMLASCCQTWRTLQFVPYLFATSIGNPSDGIDLLAFWLLFTLQWFLVGTIVVSRTANYLNSVADLITDQSVVQPTCKVFDF